MQGITRRPLPDGVSLELTSTLTIDGAESTENRIQRLIIENPVIIFSRSSCCMCHVMRRLLSTLGVCPTVIELDEKEMVEALHALQAQDSRNGTPAVFIGGAHVGGLESLMALHLAGQLAPKLREVGAIWA